MDLSHRLFSTQTMGVWVFIAIAGVIVQVIGYMLDLGPYALIPVTTLLIGIGIATLAFQTRRWVLIPAAGWYVGSLLIALSPEFEVDVFGLVWALNLGGSGIAIKLGATLDPKDEDD